VHAGGAELASEVLLLDAIRPGVRCVPLRDRRGTLIDLCRLLLDVAIDDVPAADVQAAPLGLRADGDGAAPRTPRRPLGLKGALHSPISLLTSASAFKGAAAAAAEESSVCALAEPSMSVSRRGSNLGTLGQAACSRLASCARLAGAAASLATLRGRRSEDTTTGTEAAPASPPGATSPEPAEASDPDTCIVDLGGRPRQLSGTV
jgi:hypothetical protein